MALSNDLGKFLAYTCTKIYPNESWDNLGNNDIHIKYFQGEGHSKKAFKNPKIAHLEENGSKTHVKFRSKVWLGTCLIKLSLVWDEKQRGGFGGVRAILRALYRVKVHTLLKVTNIARQKVFYIRHLIAPGCRPYPAMNNTARESSTGQGHWLIIT